MRETPLLALKKNNGLKSAVKPIVKSFDYKVHNKKVASLRGPNWRKALMRAKLEKAELKTTIKMLRVNQGMSHHDLMAKVGIKNQTTLARIERGHGYAKKHVAERIAKVLNTKLSDIFIEVVPNKYVVI